MSDGHDHPEGMPHEPAPPEPRRLIAEAPMLTRGMALGALAVGAGWVGLGAFQKSWWLAPAGLLFGTISLLAAWAAAIHITGGEKFDDHPFV